jgi:hypothetical protein
VTPSPDEYVRQLEAHYVQALDGSALPPNHELLANPIIGLVALGACFKESKAKCTNAKLLGKIMAAE